MNGNNIIVYRDGYAIAATRSNEIQTDAETIEIASATQQEWEESIVGRKSWSITTNFLVTTNSSSNVVNVLRNGERCLLSIRDRNGNVLIQGNAICTSCRVTLSRGNLSQGVFTFRGNGPLAQPSQT